MNQDHEDIWHVQLPTGELRMFTLDQLDTAFQVGMIDEGCYVRRDGSMKWRTLAEELAETPAPAPQPLPVSPTPSPVVTYQPIYSTAPTVSEIDADELPSFRGGSKKRVVGILAGAAALAAVAVLGVTRLGGSGPDAAAAAGGAVNAQAAAVAAPPAQTDPAADQRPELTDAQRKALADMDKTNERKAEERHKARLEQMENAPRPYHRSASPFRKGGNKYDPLNAKL